MKDFKVTFGTAEYEIEITDDGIIVYGCDCLSVMDDETSEKVYWALEEYLIYKGKLSERRS